MNRLWLAMARGFLWEDLALSLDPHVLTNHFSALSIMNKSLGEMMQKAQGASSSAMLEYVGHVSTLREPRTAFKLIFHRRLLSLL